MSSEIVDLKSLYTKGTYHTNSHLNTSKLYLLLYSFHSSGLHGTVIY